MNKHNKIQINPHFSTLKNILFLKIVCKNNYQKINNQIKNRILQIIVFFVKLEILLAINKVRIIINIMNK